MQKLLYTLFTTVLFIATAFSQGEQRYANGSATDQDGNTFEWINYGTQDWSIENAEVVKYRDGTEIPQVTDATEWANLTTGAWCYYDNDPSKGKLYNWYAVAGIHDNDPNTPNKTFAPEGWHVPTKAEWTTLENYLIANGYNYDGTTEGNKIAKAIVSTTGWNSSAYTGAIGNDQSLNNSSGFNAFPEGYRLNNATFANEGGFTDFWSSSEYELGAWYLHLYFYGSNLSGNSDNKQAGFSVRFVRDASSIGANGILLNGTVSAENNQIKNVADPTDAQDVTTKNYVDNSVSNTYTQAEVDNIISNTYTQAEVNALISSLQEQIDALQAATGSGTVTDQDDNSYPYLTYGDQVWTVKNAEMVTYRDGTPIPQVTDATEWANLTTGAWCYYDNDPSKGKLYNWYAVAGIHDNDENTPNKELAPEGWHVPSDAEWTTLENYLIANGYNYDSSTTENKIGKAMASTTGWISNTEPGTVGNEQSLNNSSGFNALPEGFRHYSGSFDIEGYNAFFWSSTEYDTDDAWIRRLNYNTSGLSRSYGSEPYGFSVRFIKDN
ncbi:MAG: FISUMP domain-containing protein [Flavobacteriaceae bacterium]